MYINPPVKDAPVALTRRESQERTRRRLIESAAGLFARKGIAATTIQEIAEEAGHTRGAFYAHFSTKDELCMAMLEERFDRYLERFDATLAGTGEPAERARSAGDDLTRLLETDPEWQRLSFEFAVHAAHDPAFRRGLVRRHRSLRAGVAEVFRARAKEAGVKPPIPLERLTLMTFAISTGMTTCMLLEPKEFGDDLHGELLAILFAGLERLARED